MTNDSLNFGVIGLGVGMGRCKFVHECPRARLVAVSDLQEDRGRKAGELFGTDWMPNYLDLIARDDIDVAMVMTPSAASTAEGTRARGCAPRCGKRRLGQLGWSPPAFS